MPGFIRTLGGDVNPKEIARVVPHEHGFLPREGQDPTEFAGQEPAIERRLVREFRALAAQGVNLFVETSPTGKRPVGMWKRAGEKAGMHVVATTGSYTEEFVPAIMQHSGSRGAALLCHELTVGIASTGLRAGVIKAASHDYEPKPAEVKAFRAVAEAHKQTGAPISTHCPLGPLAQVRILTEAGVAAERIALGHIEVTAWEDVRKILKTGVNFLFTNFGGENIVPENMVVAQIVDLVRRGHLSQIQLSIDMCLYWQKGRLIHRWPGGYLHLFTRLVPKLLAAGLKVRQVERMLHDNPVRHLTWN